MQSFTNAFLNIIWILEYTGKDNNVFVFKLLALRFAEIKLFYYEVNLKVYGFQIVILSGMLFNESMY